MSIFSTPREIEIQNTITEGLVKHNLFPAIVFFTFAGEGINGTLSISFYTGVDMEDLLELIEYRSLCDKNGILVFPESNTIIITRGDSITQLWSKL